MIIRTAIYARSSPDCPLNANEQTDRLREIASERGWAVANVFTDRPTALKNGKDRRPGELALINAIQSRSIEQVLIWSVCWIGKSLVELIRILENCRANGVSLWVDPAETRYGDVEWPVVVRFDVHDGPTPPTISPRQDSAGSSRGTRTVDQIWQAADRKAEG
jgi:Resolvase, N terminal domain